MPMKNRGFSLIELLIAIAIFGILLTALTAFFISQNRQYVFQSQIVEMQDNARAAMDFVVRMVRNSISEELINVTGNPGFHELSFYFNDNGDTLQHIISRDSTFSGDGGAEALLYEVDGSGRQSIAVNITNFEVDDSIENQLTITIEAKTERNLPGSTERGSITLQSTVKPRNLN